MKRGLKVFALAAAVTLVSACGSNGNGNDAGNAAGGDAIHVVVTEFGFEPVNLEIPAETPVQVTVENRGVVEHDFTIDELGIEIYAAAGETVTDTINVPAGAYHVHCSVPGHQEAGMEGTLTAG